MGPSRVRVLIIEDDARLSEMLASELSTGHGVEVAGTARSVAAAEARIAEDCAFDVALVDLRLPDGSGVELIRRLTTAHPGRAAVAFTVVDDRETVLAAVAAGARGYVLKDASPAAVRQALLDAAHGGAPLAPEAARYLLDAMRAPATSGFTELTPREQDVAMRLAEGMTYADVAVALSVGVATVQSHVKAIYGKLGITKQHELVALAFRRGVLR